MTSPIISPENPQFKTCVSCGEAKPLADFDSRKDAKDGRRNQCRDCRRAYSREWGEKNQDKIRGYGTEYRARVGSDKFNARKRNKYQANKEDILQRRRERADEIRAVNHKSYHNNLAQRREEARARYAANREERTARQTQYYAEHADERREYGRKYYRVNKERYFAANRRRNARKMQAIGTYTSAELDAVRRAQTDKAGRLICWCCGYPIVGTEPPPLYPDAPRLPLHLDHWIPLVGGGANHAGNLHYTHGICNLKKGTKHPTALGRLL